MCISHVTEGCTVCGYALRYSVRLSFMSSMFCAPPVVAITMFLPDADGLTSTLSSSVSTSMVRTVPSMWHLTFV